MLSVVAGVLASVVVVAVVVLSLVVVVVVVVLLLLSVLFCAFATRCSRSSQYLPVAAHL